MKKDKKIYCPNPACSSGGSDRRTRLQPYNVLYKCENPGQKTYYISAPRKLFNNWNKRVIPPMPGCKRLEVNTDLVFCPRCHSPVHLDRQSIRVAAVGPRNCGKTVYLSVLNELVQNQEYMKRLMFMREHRSESFALKRQVVTQVSNGREQNKTRYILPRPTQAAGAHVGEDDFANVPYIEYHVMASADKNLSWKEVREGGGMVSRNVNGSIGKNDVEMYFYDVAGEWFMPKEERSQEMKDLDMERNRKLAYLFDADLILFMIDCRQMITDRAEDARKFLKEDGLNPGQYSKAIEETVQEIIAKNHKQFYIAFCFLASDVCDHTKAFAQIVGQSDFGVSDNLAFDSDKYDQCSGVVWKAFDSFRNVIGKLICKRLPAEHMGIFAISALGRDANISTDSTGNYYIDSFSPLKSFGVIDPILWYFAENGIIEKK